MSETSVDAGMDAGRRAATPDLHAGHIPLFWRILIPNACLLGVASALLVIAPPNGRPPIIVTGLAVMIAVNGILMRWTFTPLQRLSMLMERVDPLAPGERLPVEGPPSEVTVLTDSFNRMLDRLEAERRDSARRALLAQEDERRRVAAELHDEVGQSLTALTLSLSRAADAPADPREELRRAADDASRVIEEVRAIARGLRPEALDDLGLPSALNNLCEQLSAHTGLAIERDISRHLPELAPETALVVYRIVQESLTNAVRHAEASTVTVSLAFEPPNLVAEVVDDGVGLNGGPPSLQGAGIRGMRERAVLVRGELTILDAPGGGTRVRLLVPCGAGR